MGGIKLRTSFALSTVLLGSRDIFSAGTLLRFEESRHQLFCFEAGREEQPSPTRGRPTPYCGGVDTTLSIDRLTHVVHGLYR